MSKANRKMATKMATFECPLTWNTDFLFLPEVFHFFDACFFFLFKEISASEKCNPFKYVATELWHNNLYGTLSNTEVIIGTSLYFSCHLFCEAGRQ